MRLHNDFLWATLVHIGTNLWYDFGNTRCDSSTLYHSPASFSMRFDRDTWNMYVDDMKMAGLNAIIIDLADAMIFDTHPELARIRSGNK